MSGSASPSDGVAVLPASVTARVAAFGVDVVVLFMILGGAWLTGVAVTWALGATTFVCYHGLLPWLTERTPGKALLGLRLRRLSGRPYRLRPAWLLWTIGRAGLGYLLFDGFFVVGLACAIRHPQRRPTHDFVFNSHVVVVASDLMATEPTRWGRRHKARLERLAVDTEASTERFQPRNPIIRFFVWLVGRVAALSVLLWWLRRAWRWIKSQLIHAGSPPSVPKPTPIPTRAGIAAGTAAISALIWTTITPPAGGGLPECPLDALEQADGPVEVALWYAGISEATNDTMIGMAERFNASQDQIVVRPSDQGASYEEVYRRYERTASADADQLPEIVVMEDTTLQAMVDSGQVLPAEACMRADDYDLAGIEPVVRSNYTVDGVYYPGYANVTSQVLYYNRAHWARAGLDPEDPPGTLDELYDAAVALREAGVSERPLSFKVSGALFTNWLTAVGVDMVEQGNGRDGLASEATFDTPEARELLDFLGRMDQEGLLNVFSSTEGSVDHYLALAQQQSSMLIETSGAAQTVGSLVTGEVDPDAVDLSQLVPAAAPLPGIEEPGQVLPGGGVFYMLNTSDPAQQAASWEFLEFMLQPENGRRWHTNGSYIPIVRSVQDDPEVQAFWDDDLGGSMLRAAVDQVNVADPEQPGPLVGPYTDFTNAIDHAMAAVLINDADVDSLLANAQEDVTESLGRYASVG